VKLGANRAELVQLMQKLMQRSRVRIFPNEGTRSIPLDPKLMFLCVSKWFGSIWTILFQHKTRCKSDPTSPKNAKVRTMKSHRILSQRTHPIHRWTLNSCSGAFRNVSVHLRPFCHCMKLGANRAELVQLMQKFVQ